MYEQEKKLTAKYPVYKKLRTVDWSIDRLMIS